MRRNGSKPNVIFVLTDDQGYGDLSCLGNPVIQTPALDRLYRESVRFTDFHVCPVCTPTRGELMTGVDALRNCATFVCMGRSLLRSDLPTMPEIFAESGYRTGHFGKWHLGDNYPYRPQDRGFQETIWHPGFGITSAPDFWENDYFDDHYRHRDVIEQFRGYCTDVWFEEAVSWIERSRQAGEPFFAYIATNAPHGPLWVPDHYRDPYRNEVKHNEAGFFGMIACIDENLIRLDEYLKKNDLYEDTILIFMTDNGTATGQDVYNAGMRGKKASLYEGGHRVPFFIRWPAESVGGPVSDGSSGAGSDAGRSVGCLSRSTDLLPTLIDLCGLTVPEGAGFDGVSLAGTIRGETKSLPDRMTVIQYGHTNQEIPFGKSGKDSATVLWGRWRLVNGGELYDIVEDPGQMKDVSADQPEVTARMKDHYESWWDGIGGNFETYQPLIIGSEQENPMRLCSPDWAWAYADNQRNIRGGDTGSGTWHVQAREGNYTMTLRRWPKESGLGISDPAPIMNGVDGTLPAGNALPAASARLKAGRTEQTVAVPDGAAEVSFRLRLEEGPAQIRSWWIDVDGKELAGAYYLTAERE
jgi:arylsulfatase A-like enzyme